VDTCNGPGTAWVRSTCGYFKLCSKNACRDVCGGASSALTNPTICFTPNNDGVNNGVLFYTSDPSLLGSPARANGGAMTSGSVPLAIYSDPASVWPYIWTVSPGGDVAWIDFLLNQFTKPRTVTMGYRLKRTGIINDNINYIAARSFNAQNTHVASCTSQVLSYSWAENSCYIAAPYNANFNYTGGWNSFMVAPLGDGFGGPADMMDVNFIWLEVKP
jgi:hypothetical protein